MPRGLLNDLKAFKLWNYLRFQSFIFIDGNICDVFDAYELDNILVQLFKGAESLILTIDCFQIRQNLIYGYKFFGELYPDFPILLKFRSP